MHLSSSQIHPPAHFYSRSCTVNYVVHISTLMLLHHLRTDGALSSVYICRCMNDIKILSYDAEFLKIMADDFSDLGGSLKDALVGYF